MFNLYSKKQTLPSTIQTIITEDIIRHLKKQQIQANKLIELLPYKEDHIIQVVQHFTTPAKNKSY